MTIDQFKIMASRINDFDNCDEFARHFRDIDTDISKDVWDLLHKDRYDLSTICAFARLEQFELASKYGLPIDLVDKWCVVSNRECHQAPLYLLDLIAVDAINTRN